MPTSFTTNLRLSNPGLGDTGWGATVSNGMIDLTDQAIAGTTTLSTDADVTLTTANGMTDQARQMILNCTGSRAAQRTITAPASSKVYVVINGTTGGFGVKIVGVGPTTGVVVPAGRMAVLAWNGSDFVTLGAVVDLTASGNVSFDGGTFVFNESGADKDARFEGDTDANLLFLDASTDRVGIGTSSPAEQLTVGGTSDRVGLFRSGAITQLRLGSSVAGESQMVLQYDRTAGAYQFSEGTNGNTGSPDITVTSSGNVGIGMATPAAKLDVNGAAIVRGFLTPTDAIKLGANTLAPSTTDAFIYRPANNTLAFGTASTECMRLDSSGNLGLGGTPSAWNVVGVGRALELGGGAVFTNSSNTECSIAQNAYNNSGWKYKYTGVPAGLAANINGTHAWYAAPSGTANNAISFTEVMAIDASGNLSCGGVYTNTTGSAANVFVSNTGLLQRSTSSLKYKTDIQDAAHGLADVMRLRPVTYKSKTDGDRVFGGLIAEEVHSAGLTEFVQYADDGSPDALAYGNMVSLLTKAIQEQQAVINELRARVAALEAK